MSLKPSLIAAVPSETMRVARAAFPKGNLYISMRDELGVLFKDADFAELFPRRGQPAFAPWRLVTCTRKITPSEWRESTNIKLGDSSNEKDFYGRTDRRDPAGI